MENIVIIVKYNPLYWGILNQGRKYTSKLLYMKTECCLKKISGLLNIFLLFHGKVNFLKNLQTINAGDSVEKREPSYNVGVNVNWCSHYGEQCGSFLKKKLKIELLYDPAVPLLGVYPEKLKTLVGKDTYSPVFIVALFTIIRTWKQLKCPSTEN